MVRHRFGEHPSRSRRPVDTLRARETPPHRRGGRARGRATLAIVTQVRPIHHYTYAEYLELEEGNAARHEFLNGEIYAMAGGTPKHAALAIAVAAALLGDLRGGPCRVHSSDLRVRRASSSGASRARAARPFRARAPTRAGCYARLTVTAFRSIWRTQSAPRSTVTAFRSIWRTQSAPRFARGRP